MSDYFSGGIAAPEKKPAPIAAKAPAKDDGDEGVTIHVSKKAGKLHTSIDKHDGLPADEMDHDNAKDAVAAHASALEEKFGEGPTENAEEKVAPGVHKKAGGYLEKMQGGME
jgi:hypothetical protein